MIIVYHAKEPAFTDEVTIFKPENYHRVAQVRTEDLDTAYALTNHQEFAWWENEGVSLLYPNSKRSTSIGDVLRHQGKYYVVAIFGFKEIVAIDKENEL